MKCAFGEGGGKRSQKILIFSKNAESTVPLKFNNAG
jgi:hypothetical protein